MRDSFSAESPRFHVFKTDDEGSHINEDEGDLSTDNWDEVIDFVLAVALTQRGYAEQPRHDGDVREFSNLVLRRSVTINDCGTFEGEGRYQLHHTDSEGCSENAFDLDSIDSLINVGTAP